MFSLLRGFLLTSSPSLFKLNFKAAFSFQRGVGEKSSPKRNCSHLLCFPFCVICIGMKLLVIHRSIINIVSQTINKHISLSWMKHKALPGHRRQSLCCLETQNAAWLNVTWCHCRDILQLAKTTRGSRAASTLRARWNYKLASRQASLGTSINHMIFLVQFGINQLVKKITCADLSQIALEIMRLPILWNWISID